MERYVAVTLSGTLSQTGPNQFAQHHTVQLRWRPHRIEKIIVNV